MKTYKADLHIHSSHSNKPTYWALRKFNCPESFTSPRFIYDSAIKLGMDYVTITDHNTINGALEIAHLPNTFISVELTAHFPEDGCKVHVVILNITVSIFQDLLYLRKNIYDLVTYLNRNGLTHFLAHPLYAQNEKLTAAHIEKLILLFQVFEVKNGSRAKRFNAFIEGVINGLTPEKLAFLADKHDIQPCGETPWHKAKVGGSDDHSGLFVGSAHTVSTEGVTLSDFIGSIAGRQSWAAGEDGDALTLAHSLYGISYSYYRERFSAKVEGSTPFIKALLNRFFSEGQERLSFVDKIKFFVQKNLPEFYDSYDGRSFEEILDKEAKRLLNDAGFLASISSENRNRKIFAVTSYLANRMIYIYTERLTKLTFNSGFFSLVHSLSTIGLVHLLVSPYYLSFHHQHRGKALMRELDERFTVPGKRERREKIALFTDTLHEINGVAITIKRLIETAKTRGIDLVVITSSPDETSFKNGVMNFKAIGDFVLPEYPELKLHFPPILDVIDYFEREEFTQIHVSTPGTVGLLALAIAKLMDMPISGTYHTDIPQYVRSLTSDEILEKAAWSYMIWFYNQMGEVMVPSASTRAQLIENGLPAEKTRPLPRWVDTELFSPAKKDPCCWSTHGFIQGVKFLYVGRLSKEKNLELLADAFMQVKASFVCSLIVVGDGPYRNEMEERLKGYPVLFTGFKAGDELQRIYASADIFVFPSATDTFGNVVLEAQASGLPVIVSDEGGPRELMCDGETGLVTHAGNKEALIDAMFQFLIEPQSIGRMGEAARTFTEINGINSSETYSTILCGQSKAANY